MLQDGGEEIAMVDLPSSPLPCSSKTSETPPARILLQLELH